MKKILLLMLVITTFLFGANDIIERQKNILVEIEKDLQANKYSIEDPFIFVNPFELSPQSALISFSTEKEVKISIFLKDGKKQELIYSDKKYRKNHRIELVGLFSGKNEVTIVAQDKNKKKFEKSLVIRTEKAPKQVKLEIEKLEKGVDKDFLLLIPSGVDENLNLSAYDNQGRLRWYIDKKDIGGASPFLKLSNGHFMVFSEKVIKIPYYVASAYEMDYMGRIYREFQFNARGHHEILELPNGNLLVAGNLMESKTEEDTLLEYDNSGKLVNIFDFKEILDMKDEMAPQYYLEQHFRGDKEKAKHDWMHINAISFNPKTNEILVSARHLNALISVDYTTKEINWILADPRNEWLKDKHKEKLLQPSDKNFNYMYGQHAVKFLKNGNILVYDNGNFSDLYHRGILDSMKDYDPNKNVTRGVELSVNNGKVKTIWEYSLPNGYTPFIGDINKLGKNHYIINFGGILKIEGKPTDDVFTCIFGNVEDKEAYARIVEVKNNKVVFEAKTSGEKDNTVYRATRINIFK